MDLKNKNVIYVGGYGGIGFASCKVFLQNEIASLAIFDLKDDNEKLAQLQAINKSADIFFIQLDLIDKQNIEQAFAKAHERMERFDVVVNGSGIMNETQIERTVEINLLGVIFSTLAAIHYMDKSKGGNGGCIVNISSLVGLDAYGGYAVYTATKYGINGFTRALSDPFYNNTMQIKFITICPSTTETPMLVALRINPVCTFDKRPPLPESLRNNQSAEECAENLIKAVKIGENGSFWMLYNNQLKEYKYPEISESL